MEFRQTEEQELIRANIRELCQKYLDPIAVEIDENSRYPQEVFAKLALTAGWNAPTRRNTAEAVPII